MKLATIFHQDRRQVAIVVDQMLYPLSTCVSYYGLTPAWDTDMKSLIISHLDDLVTWYQTLTSPIFGDLEGLPYNTVKFLPLYSNPDKIWGIGLNYADHAADLDEGTPDQFPGSFMRPATTIIGHGDTVQLPSLSQGTTGEGELGVIIGKKCRNVDQGSWLDVVAGFTTIVDMTAEDILRKNPRFLTLSKSFDTYFSFGPVLITADEFTTDQIMDLKVSTMYNGEVHASNTITHMRYPPDFLVAFHSQVMTLLPGDIISTGTPRAKHVDSGDTIGASITGFYDLTNTITRRE